MKEALPPIFHFAFYIFTFTFPAIGPQAIALAIGERFGTGTTVRALADGFLHHGHDGVEGRRVVDRHFGERLAIEFDVGLP
jgi:hypothetical protein